MRNRCKRPLTERLWSAKDWKNASRRETSRSPDAFARLLIEIAKKAR